jgi:hypothetical protein
MLTARSSRSGWPCGSSARCETLAPTNSIAEAFLQAATQAPQPMHCGGVERQVGVGLGHRQIALASGARRC